MKRASSLRRYRLSSFPNGWFAVAASQELAPGAVQALHYFGQDLVLFRGENGQAHLFDAHCPHLGAHLGYGRVVSNTLQCPFHHWCFDQSGRCVQAPHVARIPPAARLQSWPLLEQDGLVYAFHHHQRELPTWQPPLKLSSEWTPIEMVRWSSRSHIQEFVENSIDALHAEPVHGALGPTRITRTGANGHIWEADWEQQWPSQYLVAQYAAGGNEPQLPSATELGLPDCLEVCLKIGFHGLGLTFIESELQLFALPMLTRFCITPIDEQQVDVRVVTSVRPSREMDAGTAAQLTRHIVDFTAADLKKDCFIFEHKIYVERPALSSADGPYATLRRWSQQFYPSATEDTAAWRGRPFRAPSEDG
jgi:phenylpropionate dioxygenase-like ring-hydroxylating dioxygenase large terminal subunit